MHSLLRQGSAGSACLAPQAEALRPAVLPNAYTLTDGIADSLQRIERARARFGALPVTSGLLHSLREEGRPVIVYLSQVKTGETLPKFKKSRRAPKTQWAFCNAVDFAESLAASACPFRERHFQMIHALVQGSDPLYSRLTPWRTRQNSIVHSQSGQAVYTPPRAQEVPALMANLFNWLQAAVTELPIPLAAGMLHYQLVTIHPFYDGNGRSARLAATLLMRRHGYGLRGAYSFEEHYARDLDAYYDAHMVHAHHDYYIGRGIADVTGWLDYYCGSVANHFEKISQAAAQEAQAGRRDESAALLALDMRQRIATGFFQHSPTATAGQLGEALGLSGRQARQVCQGWLASGFLIIQPPPCRPRAVTGWKKHCPRWLKQWCIFLADPLHRKRRYRLAAAVQPGGQPPPEPQATRISPCQRKKR